MEAVGSLVPTHFHNLLCRDGAEGGGRKESLSSRRTTGGKLDRLHVFPSITTNVTLGSVDVLLSEGDGSLVTVMCMSETGI